MQKVNLNHGVIIDPGPPEKVHEPTLLEQLKITYVEYKHKHGKYPEYVNITPELLVELIEQSGGFMFVLEGKNPKENDIHTINFILEEGNGKGKP